MLTFREFCRICEDNSFSIEEQGPLMKPNEYNKQVARQSARWKGMQIRQAHGEMEHEAGAEQSAKKARLKAIMSR